MSDPRDGVPRLPNHIFSPELSRNTVSIYHDVTNANVDHLAKKEDKEARDAWHKILRLYTRRELTKPRDRLIALSGIVDYFARTWSLRSNYLAGLWRHELPYCLLWYNVNGQANKPAVRPISYRAPSWSWAAIDGEISSERIMEQDALCIVQQCYTIPKRDSNPYGEVIKGVLVLQVALRRTTWNPIEGELFEDGHGVSEGTFDCRSDHGEIGFVSVDAAEDFSSSTVEVYAAIVAQTSTALHGIIVAPVTASKMMKDANEISATNLTFRRIGWFVPRFVIEKTGCVHRNKLSILYR
ncbi:hypothetical protein DID88_009149 [Monilinia fructigena]|uniref:Heterokaryon incompatibility domain-containing protein n=1 Tax=Monilinia fructigena TaxID=38457 RepID=A0A395IKC2_9HELO|nr:hypothetical protein DID88_009149 [Monilinia fructigena]